MKKPCKNMLIVFISAVGIAYIANVALGQFIILSLYAIISKFSSPHFLFF